MDKQMANTINAEINAAMDAIAAKHGLLFKRSGCTFSSNSLRRSLEFNAPAAEGSTVTQKVVDDFKRYAEMFGLRPEILGQSFLWKGDTLTVVGLDPKKPKNCVQLQDATGKSFKASPEFVNQPKVASQLV